MIMKKTTKNYPLRSEAQKEKGIIFENNDMSIRGGKELLAYQTENIYADVHCYPGDKFQVDIQKKEVHWVNISDKIYNTFAEAKKAVIDYITKEE